jgi:hypothetical protein
MNFDADQLSVKSIKISRISLPFLVDLLVIDLVIISSLTICNNITPHPIKIETDRLYILSNHCRFALSCLDLTLTMVSAKLVILFQS